MAAHASRFVPRPGRSTLRADRGQDASQHAMGEQNISTTVDEEHLRNFMKALLDDVVALEALLAGGNLLSIQPTGYGKSLLYQLPAALLPGMTIVVSPLLALVREAWGSHVSSIRTGDGWAVGLSVVGITQCETETEALVAALETSP